MLRKRYSQFAILLSLCLLSWRAFSAEILLIEHARLIDGTGAAPRENMSVLIVDGKIAQIAPRIENAAARRLDATGLTLIPGLIDTHVHLASVPGAGFRQDSPELTRELKKFHLRAYLASGVTTVLDTAIPIADAHEINTWLGAGLAGPRVLMLAPTFSTENGYLADHAHAAAIYFEPVRSVAEVEQQLQQAEELDVFGIKVLLESGFGIGQLPLHSPEIRSAIRAGAAHRGLPLFIHSTSAQDQELALEMGAYAHVHGATFGADHLIERLQQQPAYMMSTLSIQDAWTMTQNRERLQEPLFQQNVPPVEFETASDQAAWDNLTRSFMQMVFGNAPAAGAGGNNAAPPAQQSAQQSSQQAPPQQNGGDNSAAAALNLWFANLKKVHAAGIPVVMGSDSGNWPVIPGMFHGPTSLREIELLGMAGLTPMEAILAATKTAAEMLKLSDQIGTVEVGKAADLVLLREDPLQDLRALREIEWTIQNGIAKSPQDWLQQ